MIVIVRMVRNLEDYSGSARRLITLPSRKSYDLKVFDKSEVDSEGVSYSGSAFPGFFPLSPPGIFPSAGDTLLHTKEPTRYAAPASPLAPPASPLPSPGRDFARRLRAPVKTTNPFAARRASRRGGRGERGAGAHTERYFLLSRLPAAESLSAHSKTACTGPHVLLDEDLARSPRTITGHLPPPPPPPPPAFCCAICDSPALAGEALNPWCRYFY